MGINGRQALVTKIQTGVTWGDSRAEFHFWCIFLRDLEG